MAKSYFCCLQPSFFFFFFEKFWIQAATAGSLGTTISVEPWWEYHLAGRKHSMFGMTFVFSAVAAVYTAFREKAEAQWIFARAICHRDGDEATEKYSINDAHRSRFGCLITFHDLYLEHEYYFLKHSAT